MASVSSQKRSKIGTKSHQVQVHSGKPSGRSIFTYKRLYFLLALVTVVLLSGWATTSETIVSGLLGRGVKPLKPAHLIPSLSAIEFTLVVSAIVGFIYTTFAYRSYYVFAWNCFVKPFLKSGAAKSKLDGLEKHQERLEDFYKDQASIYDTTRRRLLRGRSTMLKLCAAQLRQYYPCSFDNFEVGSTYNSKDGSHSVVDPSAIPSPPLPPSVLSRPNSDVRFAWIDIGGGTGENIERMNLFFPIRNFDKVYLVDITPSLCEVARQRFARLGWDNVTVLCMDAEKFEIPKEDLIDGELEIALITMSYSLSMMESCYGLVDRLSTILSPTGIIGIADFYVSSKRSADPTRQLSWFMRWFWSVWFDLDNIYLHPSRREYLEYKFATIKSLNAKNPFVKPFVKIPYYVWVGASKSGSSQLPPLNIGSSATATTAHDSSATTTPTTTDSNNHEDEDVESMSSSVASLHTVVSTVDHKTLSRDHVHGQGLRWRQKFELSLIPRFSTYIYAFTWEDPRVDLQYLNLTKEDRMMVITSGGCNVLEYAIRGPARIHAVDLNPCQNNMLELKLAGISALNYSDFWSLFGEGFIPKFSALLDTHLSPHLSPFAYHFWKQNSGFSNLYKTGCSGLAIRVFQFVTKVRGLKSAVERMCSADTVKEQNEIWLTEVRPHFLSKWLVKLLNNDRFLWGALGVPPAQMSMVLEDQTAYDFLVDSFDPVIAEKSLRDDNYFYYMPLMLRYLPTNCPGYLSESGFDTLKSNPEQLDAIRIHTDTIINVLNTQCYDGELTKVILMDHLDWFSPEDADAEISAVAKKMRVGGRAFWRSAGKRPWYNEIFERRGFRVFPLQVREGSTMFLDRVNMYPRYVL
ncbi:hypothetical protein SmJEL517_g05910 [Synchytrium microbalum]|uniref:Methyltransferase domain-containing protein n=1 Tax=Synchytrium microbalum TaxID=1806994 RepID=A0A507BXM1_9FUNG|nr:uncharacterized protein SmJEL517_g05910 [Synchytrium microbalum]TPX30534.1 hypothetical protein SmJEL517_g05910 [Synchytrium microbalum]